jgi:hypothetical protein
MIENQRNVTKYKNLALWKEKDGWVIRNGKEHCKTCIKFYKERFEEVANHERLAVGSKKVDKKYAKKYK